MKMRNRVGSDGVLEIWSSVPTRDGFRRPGPLVEMEFRGRASHV